MRTTLPWRLVKFLVVSAVIALPVQILLGTIVFNKQSPKPNAIPPEQYQIISPATYKYVLNQPAVCKDKNPFLVFIIPVSPGDFESRDAIRKTWGAPGLVPRMETLTLFYVGLPEGGHMSDTEDYLEKESREYSDIIQMDFLDSYHNLTIKTMMIMNWITTHCQNASYAMKVDADIFVNVFYFVKLLRDHPRQDYITGSVIRDGRPRRDSRSKWHLSKKLYPEDIFPPYVSGAGYIFSTDLARKLSWASKFVRMIPLEDVYVGLCLRVLGVRPVYSRSLWTQRNLFEVRKLEYDTCTFAKRVIVTGFNPSQLLHIWQDFSQGHLSC